MQRRLQRRRRQCASRRRVESTCRAAQRFSNCSRTFAKLAHLRKDWPGRSSGVPCAFWRENRSTFGRLFFFLRFRRSRTCVFKTYPYLKICALCHIICMCFCVCVHINFEIFTYRSTCDILWMCAFFFDVELL